MTFKLGYKIKTLHFFLLFGILPTMTYAAKTLTPAQSTTDLQNKALLRDNINRALKQNRDSDVRVTPSTRQPVPLALSSDKKYIVHDIVLDSNGHHQFDSTLMEVISQYKNTKMGSAEIFSLLREMTNALANEGLVTSIVELRPSNLRTGTINLRINWGYIQGWLIDGHPVTALRDQLMLAQAIPAASARLLNMRDIDQALETLNNERQSVRIDIQPSSAIGYSWLNVTRAKVNSPRPIASLSFDNSGSGTAGHDGLYRYSVNATFNNVLAGVDTVGLTLNTHHVRKDEGNSDYYMGVNYSLPFGYNSLSLQGTYSSTRKQLSGYYGQYLSKSSTGYFNGRLTRTIYRDQNDKVSIFSGMQYRHCRNYLAGQFLEVNSVPYTTLNLGGQYITTLAGGRFYSDLTWNKGVSWWSGHDGALNLNDAPIMVNYLSFNDTWTRAFTLASKPFSVSLNLSGQYSPNTLMNDFRLAVGDDYTVRGFKGSPFLADSGVSMNNTLNLPGLTSDNFSFTPFVGLDSAWLQDVHESGVMLLGGAVGGTAVYHALSGTATFGTPLYYDHTQYPDIDPWVATFNIKYML